MKIIFTFIALFAVLLNSYAEGVLGDFSSAFGRVPTMNKREASAIREAREESDSSKRIDILSEAAGKSWAGSAVFFNLANLEFAAGRHAEAISHYKTALDKTPSFFEAQKNLALATAAKGDKKAALTEMKKALALSGGSDADILRWISTYHSNAGDFTAALWACSQALIYKPEDGDLKVMRAYLLYKTRLYSECAGDCEKILEAQPCNKSALLLLAKSRASLGDLNAALSPLEILDKCGKASETDIRLYADILFNLKRYADSARAYARIKSKDGCGRAALALTAVGEYEAALKVNADSNLEHKIKAACHLSKGDLKGAKEEMGIYLNSVPDDLHAEYFQAGVLAKLSEYEGARLRFRGLASYPEFRKGALMGILHCSVALGDLDDALRTAKTLEREYPGSETEKYLKYLDLNKNEMEKSAQ